MVDTDQAYLATASALAGWYSASFNLWAGWAGYWAMASAFVFEGFFGYSVRSSIGRGNNPETSWLEQMRQGVSRLEELMAALDEGKSLGPLDDIGLAPNRQRQLIRDAILSQKLELVAAGKYF